MTDPRIKAAVARLGLSPRESQIVAGLAAGKATERVAAELSIHQNTVRTHLRKIFTKLEVNSRVELLSQVLANVLEDCDGDEPSDVIGSCGRVGTRCW